MLSVCFCSNFKDQSIFKSRKKSKYVAYLYVLETIQIASQVNSKTTQQQQQQEVVGLPEPEKKFCWHF